MAIRKSITHALRSSRALLLAFATLLILIGIPSRVSITPTASCSTCDIENAMVDCKWKQQDYYNSCMDVGGASATSDYCYSESLKIYEGCMKAWGCRATTSFPGGN